MKLETERMEKVCSIFPPDCPFVSTKGYLFAYMVYESILIWAAVAMHKKRAMEQCPEETKPNVEKNSNKYIREVKQHIIASIVDGVRAQLSGANVDGADKGRKIADVEEDLKTTCFSFAKMMTALKSGNNGCIAYCENLLKRVTARIWETTTVRTERVKIEPDCYLLSCAQNTAYIQQENRRFQYEMKTNVHEHVNGDIEPKTTEDVGLPGETFDTATLRIRPILRGHFGYRVLARMPRTTRGGTKRKKNDDEAKDQTSLGSCSWKEVGKLVIAQDRDTGDLYAHFKELYPWFSGSDLNLYLFTTHPFNWNSFNRATGRCAYPNCGIKLTSDYRFLGLGPTCFQKSVQEALVDRFPNKVPADTKVPDRTHLFFFLVVAQHLHTLHLTLTVPAKIRRDFRLAQSAVVLP
jgi:hypothetical protein